jgi:PucR family transcriptional regulator, purine catabolism regulatory protein
MLTVRQVLAMPVFAESSLVAGEGGLDREVRWAHPVDIPQASQWVNPGELLLTTFFGFRDDPQAQRGLIAELAEKGLAGVVVAVGEYLDHVPEEVRCAADAAGFPIVELPWSVRLEDVVRAVSEHIINEQYQLYKQSLAIHGSLTRVVLDGGGLPDVARELCKLLRRPVEIDDVSFNVLAVASEPGDPIDEGRRTSIREGQTSAALLEHLRASGVLGQVRTTLAPQRIAVDERTRRHGMTMERILAPIVVARKIHGYVWIIGGGRDLEPLDFHAIEHAATVAALILFRDETAHQAEERLESRVINRLLSAEPQLDNILREEAARFRLRLEAPHAVVLADPSGNDVRDVERAARVVAQRAGLAAAVGERAGRVVALLECGRAEAVESFCRRFAEGARLLDAPIHIGASPIHGDVATLQRAYQQALEALTLLPASGDNRHVMHFDELGLLHWLYAVPAGALAENAYARRLQRLAESDRTRDADLLHTLDVFLDCDGNGVRAAEKLIIHRHTLKYRLKRIEEICDVDLGDPMCKLNLRAALLLRRVRASRMASI